MVEFTLNSAISTSSGFAPFKLNYRYMPNMNPGVTPDTSSAPGIRHFIQRALQNLADAHDAIIESCIHQTHYTNRRRHDNDEFRTGDLVYVSTADLSLPKGQASKLLPKYVGPFKVTEVSLKTLSYQIELPTQLQA